LNLQETRHQLLALKPANRMYWVGLAISYHLLQKYDTAVSVITSYQESLKEPEIGDQYEHSEMLLYKCMLLEESGQFEKTLEELENIKKHVVDIGSWKETKARVLLKLNRAEAVSIYEELVRRNSDCRSYIDGLRQCKKLKGSLNTFCFDFFFQSPFFSFIFSSFFSSIFCFSCFNFQVFNKENN